MDAHSVHAHLAFVLMLCGVRQTSVWSEGLVPAATLARCGLQCCAAAVLSSTAGPAQFQEHHHWGLAHQEWTMAEPQTCPRLQGMTWEQPWACRSGPLPQGASARGASAHPTPPACRQGFKITASTRWVLRWTCPNSSHPAATTMMPAKACRACSGMGPPPWTLAFPR